ncbi:Gmad2 immunoglobulin-like domain-containing protein [Corallococcus sp. EGB]|uniref:Gmad2 immunoglobulin-like domain-containing protein n=1 Tax=Corallococcus sp. EGB TaxID=1521117 RepID=UPI001CBD6567|nr:Gmad2 immunoglobulin-like domain-containing protein [Corallococcus sp. EGB]
MTSVGAPSSRALVRLLLSCTLLGSVALASCRDPAAASGTALFVTADFDPALDLTQLRVTTTVADGTPVPEGLLPEDPSRLLRSGETFRVLLAGASDGTQATVRVDGLREDGTVAATGETTANVRGGYEVEASVRLASSGAGTFCLDCPDGCCRGGFCTARTFRTCGVGGVACESCDEKRADTCTHRGTCGCGTGNVCGANADSCNQGRCVCGSSSACGAGQACISGQCRCDPSTCGGCCNGNTCVTRTDKNACGINGQNCKKCDKRCNPDGSCD